MYDLQGWDLVKRRLNYMHRLHRWDVVIRNWGDKHGDMCELHCWHVLSNSWGLFVCDMSKLWRWNN